MMKHLGLFLLSACLCATSAIQANSYQQTTQKEIDGLTQSTHFAMPKVVVPKFAKKTFNILNYGADPTGAQLSTQAIQSAINECNAKGGGTVIIPEGIYTTGPISLKSNVRLYTERNALVVFSPNMDLYPIYDTWFEGLPTKRCQSPISAFNAENIAITGEGVFDGSGAYWRPVKKAKMNSAEWKQQLKKGGVVTPDGKTWYPSEAAIYAASLCQDQNVPVVANDSVWPQIRDFLRPVMVHLVGCKNILLEGVTFQNSPAWNLHPMLCQSLTLRHLTVRNPSYSQNGDGVDVESCKGVVIDDCSFDVGDDAICLKSGKNQPGRDRGVASENIVIDHCTVYHGHGGFVIGSEMSGGVRNVEVRNNLYIGTDVGLRFKSTRGRGGIVENIYISDIYMTQIPNEAITIDLYYGGKGAGEESAEEVAARINAKVPEVSEETPQFRNLFITNVVADNVEKAMYLNGLPEMKIQNVVLDKVQMTANKGVSVSQTDNLVLRNVKIAVKEGETYSIHPSVTNIKQEK